MIVNFLEQTNNEVSFVVILLRLQKPGITDLKALFKHAESPFTFLDHDVKVVGILRKKYPKEAHVFQVRIDKKQFLRKDFSLDLYKARQSVIAELSHLIGEIRDFNGGMISKQHETLTSLKELLLESGIHNDFLLENFFYSITPKYMQSILKPEIIKELFILLIDAIDHDYAHSPVLESFKYVNDYFLLLISCTSQMLLDSIKKIIENIDIEYIELSSAKVDIYDIHAVAYLMRFDDPNQCIVLQNVVHEEIVAWEKLNATGPFSSSKILLERTQESRIGSLR